LLESAGCCLSVIGVNLDNPLFAAAERKHEDVVDLLLSKFSSENISEHCTILESLGSHLVRRGKEIAEFLLPYVVETNNNKAAISLLNVEGINANAPRVDGATALIIASQESNIELVDELLNRLTPTQIQSNFDVILKNNLQTVGEFLLPKVSERISATKESKHISHVEKGVYRKQKSDFSKTIGDFKKKDWRVPEDVAKEYSASCVIS
jgi:ankyrin repeat protein